LQKNFSGGEMKNIVSRDSRVGPKWPDSPAGPPPLTGESAIATGSFPLRLVQEGERVRIVSVSGGKGVHERLAGVGLHIGAEVWVLQNSMTGKLLLGHEGSRLYLGGGMAHKIQVVVIKGGNR
jgi:ferrous iron transport protein A